jgi:DNA adenine methylase
MFRMRSKLGSSLLPARRRCRFGLRLSDGQSGLSWVIRSFHWRSSGYVNHVRARFNADRDPVDLLYLLCRCVKNAVRFNAKGQFTQSVDKRRLGMSPDKMSRAIGEASALLGPITEIRSGDWLDTVAEAQTSDFVYMDPPYMGTSAGRDRRYAEWMSRDRLVDGLVSLRASRLRFALSYDGRVGERTYGEPLPADLGMTHLMLHAGRSSQATLNGSSDHTYESLYLSHGISLAASQSGPEQGAQSSFLRAA